MLNSRLIPCLLLDDGDLVKTTKFSDPRYIGDPLNAVRIFNEKVVDELMLIDIGASVRSTEPDYELISKVARECRMPLCYGGGIKNLAVASKIVQLGVEKVSLSSSALLDPDIIEHLSSSLGSQSVVVTLDIKKSSFLSREYSIYILNGKRKLKLNLYDTLNFLQELGAGEIVFNFISNDGTLSGAFDIDFISSLRSICRTPITIMGGVSSYEDIKKLTMTGVSGIGVGAFFVFKGKLNAVLINYPQLENKLQITAR